MKFFTILVSAMVLSMSAMAKSPINYTSGDQKHTDINVGAKPSAPIPPNLHKDGYGGNGVSKKKMSITSIRKADSNYSSLEGTWEFIFGDLLNQESTDLLTAEYICVYEEEWDDYYFTATTNQYLPFLVYYDNDTGEVELPFSWIGYNDEHYIFQGGWHIDFEEGKVVFPEHYYFTFDKNNGSIMIDEDCGICWSAYSTETFEYVGDYEWLKMEEAAITEAADIQPDNDPTNWTSIGNATLMDGWVMPGLGIDQTDPDNQYEVPLQRNNSDGNVYRLVDPYHIGPVAEFNESKVTGYIQFDVTDPEHVVFHRVNAGYANAEQGIVTFYCYNLLGYFMEYAEWKMTVEEMLRITGDQIPYTTFRNGIVSLGYTAGTNGPLYDANFGYQGDKVGGNQWYDRDGMKSNMTAAIIFPEEFDTVESIPWEAGSLAEYYNLQGQKIANPRPGQIVIKVQGSETEKIIFK